MAANFKVYPETIVMRSEEVAGNHSALEGLVHSLEVAVTKQLTD